MSQLVAVVDLGSNAARFLLARVWPGKGFRVLHQQRVQTRLGGGRWGTLPGKAVDQTVRATRRFLRRALNGADGSQPRIIAVATSAVREAADPRHLLGPIRSAAGVDVRILSAHEEARLGALAALHSLTIRNGVVIDLGGGSLQVTRVRRGHIASAESLPLGAVRLTRRLLRHDPPTSRELRALRTELRDQVLGVLPLAEPGDLMVGMGGTVRTLARMHLRWRGIHRGSRHGLRLKQSDVTAIRERLEALPLRRRRRLRGLRPERADIILAGAVVIEELMIFGNYLGLTVCQNGVRDGLLLRETFDGKG